MDNVERPSKRRMITETLYQNIMDHHLSTRVPTPLTEIVVHPAVEPRIVKPIFTRIEPFFINELRRTVIKDGVNAEYKRLDNSVYKVTIPNEGASISFTIRLSKNVLNSRLNMGKEANLLLSLSHPYIPKLITHSKSIYGEFIALEFCEGEDMLDFVTNNPSMPFNLVRYIFKGLLNVFSYVHSKGIAHKDVKPENIIYKHDRTGRWRDDVKDGIARPDIKIIDWEFACIDNTICGSPEYVSSEIVKGENVDPRYNDVWALGCVLYVMVARSLPFIGADQDQVFINIVNNAYNRICHTLPHSSVVLFDAFFTPWEERITLEQLKTHKWLEFRTEERDCNNF